MRSERMYVPGGGIPEIHVSQLVGKVQIGLRPLKTYITAPFNASHYRTLFRMFLVYPDFLQCLIGYIFAVGKYPRRLKVRFGSKVLLPMLYNHADLLTINEIFCREDYTVPDSIAVVVDLGSNIGLSALYFLNKSPSCHCYLYEPVPLNIERLRINLEGFEHRYTLTEAAVANRTGLVSFGIEPTGRYGGIEKMTTEQITVPCHHINDVLAEVLQHQPFIDILKIDTEGAELDTVAAIDAQWLQRIGEIVYEGPDGLVRLNCRNGS